MNKTGRHNSPVTNPGPSGVFLFPNASTFNVPAFTPFPFPPGGRLYVGHVFSCPRSRPAVLSLPDPFPDGRRRPSNVARKLLNEKTGVDVINSDKRSDPFPAVLRRPTIPSGRSHAPDRPTAVLTVLPVLSLSRRSTPTVDPVATPTPDGRRPPTVDDPGRSTTVGNPGRPVGPARRPPTTVDDDPRRRSDGRPTTSTPVGRRSARNRNGGLRIKG